MQIVKDKFIQLSIKKQILIGICSVNVLVFVLVTGVLLISSYVIINTVYLDLISYIENEENLQLSEISNLCELQISTTTDLYKLSTQWVSNYKNNLQKYNHLLFDYKNFTNYDETYKDTLLKVPYNAVTTLKTSLENYNRNNNPHITKGVLIYNDKISIDDLNIYFKLVSASKTLITFHKTSMQKMIRNVFISSNEKQIYFSYPNDKLNPNFNDKFYFHGLFTYLEYLFYTYTSTDLNPYNNVTYTNIRKHFYYNPYIFPNIQSLIPYSPFENKNPTYILSEILALSLNYKDIDIKENYTSICDDTQPKSDISSKIKDYTLIVTNGITVTEYVENINVHYTGIKTFVTDRTLRLYSNQTCFSLINLFDFYNNLNGTNSFMKIISEKDMYPQSILDCLIYQKGREKFINAFYSDNSNLNIRRKYIIAILDEMTNNAQSSINITEFSQVQNVGLSQNCQTRQNINTSQLIKMASNVSITDHIDFKNFEFTEVKTSKRFKHKIVKSRTPVDNIFLVNKRMFLTTFTLDIFLFKAQQEIENDFSSLFQLYLGILYSILSYNLVIWSIIMLILFYLLIKVSNSLTKPIINLTKCILDLNSGDADNIEKRKQRLDKINYPDDTTINELFKVCKTLIKGGFSQDNDFAEKNKTLIKNDDITKIVKNNNLIIQERFIYNDSTFESADIFNYVEKKDIFETINDKDGLTNKSINSGNESDSSNQGITLNPIKRSSKKSIGTKYQSKDDLKTNKNCYVKTNSSIIYEPIGYYSIGNIYIERELKEIFNTLRNKLGKGPIFEAFTKLTDKGSKLRTDKAQYKPKKVDD